MKYNQRCGEWYRCNPCPPGCPYSCTGPTGDMGPTGPQGIQGPMGPTGIQGPQGIQGPPGRQGIQGLPGPAGADGLAATIEIEDSTRVPFDDNPYVQNVGTPNHAIFRFGIPAGTPGTPGEKGEKGERGTIGEDGKSAYQIALDNGYIGTETEWLSGLKGETGPTGPIAAMVPFSISKYGTYLSTGKDGKPMTVAFSGFSPGYAATAYLQEGEWESGTIRVRDGNSYPTAFVMTFNGTLKKIHVLFSTDSSGEIEEGSSIRPFVCLAVSTTDELVYQILPETIVYADPYEGGTTYPMHTIRRGSRTDLNTVIPEGALVAIVTGIMGTGMTRELSLTLSVSGGLYLE